MIKFASPSQVRDISDCFFYHKMELPGIGVVGGAWDLRGRFDDYIDNADLAGKSVLDIGTASGFLTFEAEKRGAEVVSFDMDDKRRQHYLPYKGHICYENKAAYTRDLNIGYQKWKNGYWFAHNCFGSKARMFYGDIYDLPVELGSFDVVIVGSIMMHLQNPIIALESISRVSADKIILVDTVDVNQQDRFAHLEFRADNPTSGHYIWWVYSVGLYREVFAMLGYDLVRVAQKFYTCNDYNVAGQPVSNEVLLTTLTAERKRRV